MTEQDLSITLSFSLSSDASLSKELGWGTVEDTQLSPEKIDQIRLETYLNKLNLSHYELLSEEEKVEYARNLDAMEIFYTINHLHNETNILKIENYVLEDFLLNNDPNLLVGIEDKKIIPKSHMSSMDHRSISTHRFSETRSTTRSHAGRTKGKISDVTLNLRGKIELAEKLNNDLEKRIAIARAKGTDDLKVLYGEIKQYEMELSDQATALNGFRSYFARNEKELKALSRLNEEQIKKKLYRYVMNYQSSAQLILNKMRLQIDALTTEYTALHSEIVLRREATKFISSIDFEEILSIRNFLLKSDEEKRRQIYELKMITANAEISMRNQRYSLVLESKNHKRLTAKTDELSAGISRLKREINRHKQKNNAYREQIRKVRSVLKRFDAPSVPKYIDMKDQSLALEKEKIQLERKFKILFMKLNNLLA